MYREFTRKVPYLDIRSYTAGGKMEILKEKDDFECIIKILYAATVNCVDGPYSL